MVHHEGELVRFIRSKLQEGAKMKDLQMYRSTGYALAIMNALVKHFCLGNFIVELDTGIPECRSVMTRWATGQTDTGRTVSCSFLTILWGHGFGLIPEVKVSFGYGHADGQPQTYRDVICRYTPGCGIVVV